MAQPNLLLDRYVRPYRRGAVRKAMRLAKRARGMSDWETVASQCIDALRADPRLPLIWNQLGHAQKRQRDLAGAEASFRRSIAINDSWARTYLDLGRVLKLQGRLTEAAESFLSAIRLDPTVSPARNELLALGYDDASIAAATERGSFASPPPAALIKTAQAAFAARDWQNAVKTYSDLLRGRPQWAAIWVQLGHAHKEQGDLAAAEASYRRALALEPQTADTHLQLGHVLKLRQRSAEGVESYMEALRRDRECLPAKAELLALGYDPMIIEEAQTSGRLRYPPATAAVAAADRARGRRDWRTAAKHYQEALLSRPEWAAIWVQLGHAQKEQGHLAAAEASYRRALALEPHSADAHLQLGHVLKLNQRPADAAESYFCAVKSDPTALDGMRARKELLGLGYPHRAVGAALQSGTLPWPPLLEEDGVVKSRRVFSAIGPRLLAPQDPFKRPPVLFRQSMRLPRGETGIFIDVQTVTSPTVPTVDVEVVGPSGLLPIRRVFDQRRPHIAAFRCLADTEMEVDFLLKGELPPDCLIRRIEVGSADEFNSWVVPRRGPAMSNPPSDYIRNLIIGTTGVCNASCIHCPTNKIFPSARWTGDMSMGLFSSLVDQILAAEMFITGYISLGLFGDGLVDRYVVDRASRLHAAFPYASLHVNTNGAAYNPRRHASLASLVDTLAIHIETLDEEKYARIMEPLKLPNVLPKIRRMIEDMPAIATIVSPVHRDNVDELPLIKAYFNNRGVQDMIFTCMFEPVLARRHISGACNWAYFRQLRGRDYCRFNSGLGRYGTGLLQ